LDNVMISQTIHVPKQSQCSYQGYHCRVGAAVPQYIPDRAVSGETAQTRYLAGHLAQSVVSHRRITAALRSYCNSLHYLKVSTECAVRVDLAGEPAGNVTGIFGASVANLARDAPIFRFCTRCLNMPLSDTSVRMA
jgi:hypothetical protein